MGRWACCWLWVPVALRTVSLPSEVGMGGLTLDFVPHLHGKGDSSLLPGNLEKVASVGFDGRKTTTKIPRTGLSICLLSHGKNRQPHGDFLSGVILFQPSSVVSAFPHNWRLPWGQRQNLRAVPGDKAGNTVGQNLSAKVRDWLREEASKILGNWRWILTEASSQNA